MVGEGLAAGTSVRMASDTLRWVDLSASQLLWGPPERAHSIGFKSGDDGDRLSLGPEFWEVVLAPLLGCLRCVGWSAILLEVLKWSCAQGFRLPSKMVLVYFLELILSNLGNRTIDGPCMQKHHDLSCIWRYVKKLRAGRACRAGQWTR